jgi:hypothetical protein
MQNIHFPKEEACARAFVARQIEAGALPVRRHGRALELAARSLKTGKDFFYLNLP